MSTRTAPHRWWRSLPAAVALAATCVVLPPGTAHADAGSLQQDVSALADVGNVGVLARLDDGGVVTTARAGVAQLGSVRPVPFDGGYRTGSVTKTFVATVLLQMVGEGRLALDDTVERWLPGVVTGNGNDGSRITVRQLLNHTSGLFDYTADPGFFATFATPEAFAANRYRHYSPRDLIAIAMSHPPMFSPGAGWAYSNTNYVLAGQIIQAVTGRPWDAEVTSRIIRPFGLTGTWAPGDTPTLPDDHADGYHLFTNGPSDRVYTDTTEDDMTWADSAGALVTTVADENRFFSVLLSGRLLGSAQLAEMQTVVPVGTGLGYGLGIVRQQLSCASGPIWWHNGGTVGYTTWVGTNSSGTTSLALSLSTTTFTDTTYVTTSSRLSDNLIRHVFCGSQSTATDAVQQLRSTLFASPAPLD